MRSWCAPVLFAIMLLLPQGAVSAQSGPSAGLQPSSGQLAAALQFQPSIDHPAGPASLLVYDPYQHGTRREGTALMIVGAAGILVGLIVDEPVVTILSAGVGGLGLYLYFR